MKLHTFVTHIETTCLVQEEPQLLLIYFQIIPLGTLVNAILWPFCKLRTVRAIWMKLHTVVEHNETMCHVQEL